MNSIQEDKEYIDSIIKSVNNKTLDYMRIILSMAYCAECEGELFEYKATNPYMKRAFTELIALECLQIVDVRFGINVYGITNQGISVFLYGNREEIAEYI